MAPVDVLYDRLGLPVQVKVGPLLRIKKPHKVLFYPRAILG